MSRVCARDCPLVKFSISLQQQPRQVSDHLTVRGVYFDRDNGFTLGFRDNLRIGINQSFTANEKF